MIFLIRLHSFFLDPRALTAPATEEVKLGPAHLTGLIQCDGLDVRGVHREGPFNADTVRYFTYRESSGGTLALAFNNVTFEALDTLFVTLDDLIVNGDIVASFERRNFFPGGQLLMYKGYRSVHDLKI
jgi:hypothetical protein